MPHPNDEMNDILAQGGGAVDTEAEQQQQEDAERRFGVQTGDIVDNLNDPSDGVDTIAEQQDRAKKAAEDAADELADDRAEDAAQEQAQQDAIIPSGP